MASNSQPEDESIERRKVLRAAGGLGAGALGIGAMTGSASADSGCATFNLPGVSNVKVVVCAVSSGATLEWKAFGQTLLKHEVKPGDGFVSANATLPVPPGSGIPADVLKINERYGMPNRNTVRLEVGVEFCNFQGWPPSLNCTPEIDTVHTFNL